MSAAMQLDADLHEAMQKVHDLQDKIGNTPQDQTIEQIGEICKV